jgi:hypothetical protein
VHINYNWTFEYEHFAGAVKKDVGKKTHLHVLHENPPLKYQQRLVTLHPNPFLPCDAVLGVDQRTQHHHVYQMNKVLSEHFDNHSGKHDIDEKSSLAPRYSSSHR